MFEARLTQGNALKKLVDAVKELCKEVNWDVSTTGISMQSMDSSHVCLVAFALRADGFDHFRCDRPLTLGINLDNLAKILKCAGACKLRGRGGEGVVSNCSKITGRAVACACADRPCAFTPRAGNNDIITLKADDNGDTLTLMFESEKQVRVGGHSTLVKPSELLLHCSKLRKAYPFAHHNMHGHSTKSCLPAS